MIAWLSAKATNLLLVALLLVGGFSAYTYYELKLTKLTLANTEANYTNLQSQYLGLEANHEAYKTAVSNGTTQLNTILDKLSELKAATNDSIAIQRAYPTDMCLDTPFPAGYIRLFREAELSLPTAGTSASSNQHNAVPGSAR